MWVSTVYPLDGLLLGRWSQKDGWFLDLTVSFVCFWFWCLYLFLRFLPWGRTLLSHLFVCLHGIVNSYFMHCVSTLCSYFLVPDIPGVADGSTSSSLSTRDVSSQWFLMKDGSKRILLQSSCLSLRAGYLSKDCPSSVGPASFRVQGGMRGSWAGHLHSLNVLKFLSPP